MLDDPSTPAIPQIHGLKYTLDKIFEEGVDARHNRHAKLNEMVHDWVEQKGFVLLPEKQFASKALTCVRNNLEMDVAGFVKALKNEKKLAIDGDMENAKENLSISNMGNETDETRNHLLNAG